MTLAQTLETFLSDHHARYSLEYHEASFTSRGTAHSAHVDEKRLAKSVLLEDEHGFVLAVLPASHRLMMPRVRDHLGRALRFAPERVLTEIFPDCSLGALPPLGAAYGLPTVLDESLADEDDIYFEAGDHETLIHMSGREFRSLLDNASRAEIAHESEVIDAAAVVREKLYESILSVGESLAAPATSGQEWRIRLRRSLASLRLALDDHISETEAPDGLLNEIQHQAPRLAGDVDQLREEHVELVDLCELVSQKVVEYEASSAVRQSVLGLLGRLAEHRHRGADIVYEAFDVDIGGG